MSHAKAGDRFARVRPRQAAIALATRRKSATPRCKPCASKQTLRRRWPPVLLPRTGSHVSRGPGALVDCCSEAVANRSSSGDLVPAWATRRAAGALTGVFDRQAANGPLWASAARNVAQLFDPSCRSFLKTTQMTTGPGGDVVKRGAFQSCEHGDDGSERPD